MTRLLWLPDKLREWGLPVALIPGWEQRGVDFPALPTVVVGHHTATPASRPGDLPTRDILVAGRPDLRGPLCQVAIGRAGVVYVIAAGKANHAGKGAWRGCTSSSSTVGIEAEHPGTGPWTSKQLDAFDATAAAVLDGLGQSAGHYCGHREWAIPAGRKVDPGGIPLEQQRERISTLLRRGPLTDTKPPEGDNMTLSDQDVKRIAAEILSPPNVDKIANRVLEVVANGKNRYGLDNLYRLQTQIIRLLADEPQEPQP